MANEQNAPESTSAAASIKKAKAESAASPAEPLGTLEVGNKQAGPDDDPRLKTQGATTNVEGKQRDPQGNKITEEGLNTPARAAKDAIANDEGKNDDPNAPENRTPSANKAANKAKASGKSASSGSYKKYVVRKTEIFAFDNELGEVRKFGVGEVVELTDADAKHFDEQGCLGPFLNDEEADDTNAPTTDK